MSFTQVYNDVAVSLPHDKATSVNRKDLAILSIRASKVLEHYNTALGCSSAIIDKTGAFISGQDDAQMVQVCALCRKHFFKYLSTHEDSEHSCEKMHKDAASEARGINGSYVYVCSTGLVYWVSPLYRNGRYAGSLIAGRAEGVSGSTIQDLVQNIQNGSMSMQDVSKIISTSLEKTHEEVQTMAQMLFLCAEAISEKPTDNYTHHLEKNELRLEHPMEKERLLLAALRRGDKQTSSKIIEELMGDIFTSVPGDMERARLRAIELVVLLSREAVSGSSRIDVLLENNNRYLRRILEAKTPEELVENLHYAAEGMSSGIFFFQGIRHASVLRKAERYIWANYTRKLSLEEIAKASGLSPPYFSTIFKEEMGENLSSYLNRLRVERAVSMLTETDKQLHEIASLCGFEDQSWFSKIFKSFTGMSPGKFKKNGGGNSELKA